MGWRDQGSEGMERSGFRGDGEIRDLKGWRDQGSEGMERSGI